MFKKFTPSTDIASQTPPKSSVQRSIRAAVLAQWHLEPETLEQIWPKKEPLIHAKCKEHISIYTIYGEPLFFQHSDGPLYPSLRLLHKYPFLLPKVGIDRGAIRFLLAGANMMCPGLTSAGGYLPPAEDEIPASSLVAVHAEGKEHAVAVGITKLGTEEMRRVNKGVGVEIATHLGDDLSSAPTVVFGAMSRYYGACMVPGTFPLPSQKELQCSTAEGKSDLIAEAIMDGFLERTAILFRFPRPRVWWAMQGSDDGTFAYDSFIRVNPRKKRKGKNPTDASTPCDRLTRVKKELEADGNWSLGCEQTLHEALAEARIRPRRVLCLGLGSPSSSRDARAQLALLCSLCAFLDIDSVHVSVYDPVFTDADKQLFQSLGMRCLDHAQGAEHALDRPTVLYMPHCDLGLYETVIRANWTLEGLCNIVFLANRFSDYVDNNAASQLEGRSPCLMRLACHPVPTSDAFPSAFNQLAVQYVSRTPLSLQGNIFWDTPAPFERTEKTSISIGSDTDQSEIIS